MDIKLDQEQMTTVVSAAILKSIDEDQRNVLIEGAIKHLLTRPPSNNGYGSNQRESPLMDAFNSAAAHVAHKLAEEMISGDETLKGKIKSLISDAFEKVFTESREKTVGKIADAIVAGMHSDKY